MTLPLPPKDESAAAQRAAFRSVFDTLVAPRAGEFDREGRIPRDVIAELASHGFLGFIVPNKFGGTGSSMARLGLLHEEAGRVCSSVRSLLTVHGMVCYAIQRWGSTAQQETWLPSLADGSKLGAFGLSEPGAGSDIASLETTAARHGDAYVLNGRKKWTSFGKVADLVLVFARCEGKHVALLVERSRPGVSVSPIDGLLGTRASMLAQFAFENVEVPLENLVGRPGFGMAAVGSTALDLGRYSVACGCVGIIAACLEASVRYASGRRQFDALLKDHQLVARLVARMATDLKAARLLCEHAGALKDAGDPATINETLVAKYFAAGAAMRAAADAVQIHGANGCSNAYPVERLFRDAKIMEIIEGSTQMQEIMISQHAFNTGDTS
jgi:alkylation response protein AidB-like acyl-CoA dehydrogenase